MRGTAVAPETISAKPTPAAGVLAETGRAVQTVAEGATRRNLVPHVQATIERPSENIARSQWSSMFAQDHGERYPIQRMEPASKRRRRQKEEKIGGKSVQGGSELVDLFRGLYEEGKFANIWGQLPSEIGLYYTEEHTHTVGEDIYINKDQCPDKTSRLDALMLEARNMATAPGHAKDAAKLMLHSAAEFASELLQEEFGQAASSKQERPKETGAEREFAMVKAALVIELRELANCLDSYLQRPGEMWKADFQNRDDVDVGSWLRRQLDQGHTRKYGRFSEERYRQLILELEVLKPKVDSSGVKMLRRLCDSLSQRDITVDEGGGTNIRDIIGQA